MQLNRVATVRTKTEQTKKEVTMSSPKPAPENMIPKGLRHIAFAARDREETYDFYHNKLGMPC